MHVVRRRGLHEADRWQIAGLQLGGEVGVVHEVAGILGGSEELKWIFRGHVVAAYAVLLMKPGPTHVFGAELIAKVGKCIRLGDRIGMIARTVNRLHGKKS